MNAKDILEDQIIIKKGRFNNFGFEPCSNSFFDFYVSSKYTTKPLIKLEDISFHLFLRKNLNDRNPKWKMPTIKQMMRRVGVSYSRLKNMMDRLEAAHLLTKQSGYKKGVQTVRNEYVLSDPIQTLEEFLTVASAGVFPATLRPEFMFEVLEASEEEPDRGNRDALVAETAMPPIAETAMLKQTSSLKQTSEKQTIDPLWEKVLGDFKMQVPANTFEMFLAGTNLVSIEDGIAVISTINGYAKDWLGNRLGGRIARALGVKSMRCVVLTE